MECENEIKDVCLVIITTHFANPVFSSLVTMYSDTLFKIILFSTEPLLQSISPSYFDFSNNSYKIETSFKLYFQSPQSISHVIAVPKLITCLFQTWLKVYAMSFSALMNL